MSQKHSNPPPTGRRPAPPPAPPKPAIAAMLDHHFPPASREELSTLCSVSMRALLGQKAEILRLERRVDELEAQLAARPAQ